MAKDSWWFSFIPKKKYAQNVCLLICKNQNQEKVCFYGVLQLLRNLRTETLTAARSRLILQLQLFILPTFSCFEAICRHKCFLKLFMKLDSFKKLRGFLVLTFKIFSFFSWFISRLFHCPFLQIWSREPFENDEKIFFWLNYISRSNSRFVILVLSSLFFLNEELLLVPLWS